jgi:DNA polymerase-3 subunit epsilon
MGFIDKDIFLCLDCETTGLDAENERIIEVAAVRFTMNEIIDRFETLIDPERPISPESMAIHHITDAMVQGKPKVQEVLPALLKFVGKDLIIGHGIRLDIDFITFSAKRHDIPCSIQYNPYIDTLRLARLYGESPTNSLEMLREHFNIADEGAHRAMNDVVVNIEVFKFLASHFKKTEQMLERLKRPIQLKAMPLGKHKGRPFSEIPVEYLLWAVKKDFDQDLMFSLRTELKKRKQGGGFEQAGNPFSNL